MQSTILVLGNKLLFQALHKSEKNNSNFKVLYIEHYEKKSQDFLHKYIVNKKIHYIYPTSLNWRDYICEDFLSMNNVTVLAANKIAARIEKDRIFASHLCQKYSVPFIRSHAFDSKQDAVQFVKNNSKAYVVKNRYSSPKSKIKTSVCFNEEQTLDVLKNSDCSDGVFLQEYAGEQEAGHTVFVNNGKIYPLCTNQEYKKLYTGNLGKTLSTPMGGLIEIDLDDRYQLVSKLVAPLLPWLKKVNYNGPLQVTAIKHNKAWHVLEFNARLGVTCGPLIMLSLQNFLKTFKNLYSDQPVDIQIQNNKIFSTLLRVVTSQYPTSVEKKHHPIYFKEHAECDYFWDTVVQSGKNLFAQEGEAIVNIIASSNTLKSSILKIYASAKDIHCYESFYRTDIGISLWPITS